MLTVRDVNFLRKKLSEIKQPLFIHDNDPDGLSSFLLLYRYKKEGRGVILKTSSILTPDFIRFIKEYSFDSVFILDIPVVEQEFIDKIKVQSFWIDHHQPIDLKKVKYYNPRIKDPNAYIPTTRMAYQITERQKEDLWIAMVGCLSDYHFPDFAKEFAKEYPDLMDSDADITTALYDNKIGVLVRVFSFLLKGKSSDVRKNIKVLSRIKNPKEILDQKSPAGKFLYKKFYKVEQYYQEIVKQALKKRSRSKLLIFEYQDAKWSLTNNIANETITRNKDKVVIIARKHNGKMKSSLRADVGVNILEPLQKSIEGMQATGGGHFNACGAVILQEDWDLFLKKFKRELKDSGIIKEIKEEKKKKSSKVKKKVKPKTKKKVKKT